MGKATTKRCKNIAGFARLLQIRSAMETPSFLHSAGSGPGCQRGPGKVHISWGRIDFVGQKRLTGPVRPLSFAATSAQSVKQGNGRRTIDGRGPRAGLGSP